MPRIKICGLTTLEDIQIVNALLPDYIGFVFAPSKRQVSCVEAQCLRQVLDSRIHIVGVFVDEQIETIKEIVNTVGCHMVQLHGHEDDAYRQQLRQLIQVPIIQAVGVDERGNVGEVGKFYDYLLFDSRVAGKCGGTGERFDWRVLTKYEKPFFIAGGIGLDNIQEALGQGSYCIDVSSGAEENGHKVYGKVKRIIEKVRGYDG